MKTVDLNGNKYLIDLNNSADVFDTVVDATNSRVKLDQKLVETIVYSLYRDRRGGDLGWLWGSGEFLNSLNWQLER